MSHFYETEYEIWADFGAVGNTGKKIGADYEQLLMAVFLCFLGQKLFLNTLATALKTLIIFLLYVFF